MPVVNAQVISNPNRDAPNPWIQAMNVAGQEIKGYNAEQQRMLENETNIRLKDYDSKREEIGLMLLSPDEGVKTQAMNMIKQRFALEGRATGQQWNDSDLEQLALQEATFLSQLTPERGAKAYAMYHVPEENQKQNNAEGVRVLPGQQGTQAIDNTVKSSDPSSVQMQKAGVDMRKVGDVSNYTSVPLKATNEGQGGLQDWQVEKVDAWLKANKRSDAMSPGTEVIFDGLGNVMDVVPSRDAANQTIQALKSKQVSLGSAKNANGPSFNTKVGEKINTGSQMTNTVTQTKPIVQAPKPQATGAVNTPPPENIMQFGARMTQEQAQANAQALGAINPAQRQAQILALAQGMAGLTSIPSLAQQMQARSQATGATAPSSTNVPAMFQRQAPTQAQSSSTSQTSSSSDLGNVKRDFQAMIANQPLARQNLAMETFENMTRATPNLTPAQESSVNKINLEVEKTLQDIVPQGAKLPTTPQEKAQESQNFSRLVRSTSALVNSPTVKSWSKEMDRTYKARFNSLDAEDLSAAGLEGAGNIRAQKEVAKINGEYALAAAAIKADAEKGNATAKNMETIAKYSMEMLQLIRGKSTLSEAELLKTNETYKGYTNIMGKLLGLGESDVKRIPVEGKPFWQPLLDWIAPTQEVIAVGGTAAIADIEKAKAISEKFKFNTNK